jgi:hypothetical protein
MANTASHSKQRIEQMLDSEKYAAIPEHTRHSLKLYLFHRVAPGYTLRCLLEGEDAVRTILNFDEAHVAGLRPLCMFLHWEVPSNVFGSKEKVGAWLDGELTMFENWQSVDPDEKEDE